MAAMAARGHETTAYGTFPAHVARERAVLRLALRQHGVVSLAQLRSLGLSSSGVRNRRAAGRLRRVHQGVYSVDVSELSVSARYMAAVLACGPGAALSHRSAADLWDLRACERRRIDVTVPARAGRSRVGIEVHRAAGLEAADVQSVHAIPCTSVARTLMDLAEVVDRRSLERALDQAEVLRLFDLRALQEAMGRAGRRHGRSLLEQVLAEHAIGSTLTRRELEERFLALCDRARLPRPRVNLYVALPPDEFVIDFAWPEQRVAVETDSHRFHGGRAAFERDRRRDQRLSVAGWRPLRFTWRHVVRHPEEVAATVRSLLEG
jgi:very-short-patch-repair endonuclease